MIVKNIVLFQEETISKGFCLEGYEKQTFERIEPLPEAALR